MELLSPAGSFECAVSAVKAGADAIYMGGPLFSARAFAESSARSDKDASAKTNREASVKTNSAKTNKEASNSSALDDVTDSDMLLAAIDYCHLRGVKVYMALNTLMKEEELRYVKDYLRPYYEAGVDAVIVQDLGLMGLLRESFPKLPIHISTQAAVTGPRYGAMLKAFGVERLVLARELSLKEIERIKEETGLSIEVFCHGALCYSYSGLCLMSSAIGGRSGNRGRCAGPCRLPYNNGSYLLSLKDLNTLKDLPLLYKAGVDSLKIEGRMKSPIYVAGVTSVYRKYLDRLLKMIEGKEAVPDLLPIDKSDLSLLSEVFDRGGNTDGYLFKQNGREMVQLCEKESRAARGSSVSELIEKDILNKDDSIKVDCKAEFVIGMKPKLSLSSYIGDQHFEAVCFGDTELSPAKNAAMGKAELRERLSKSGGTDFKLRDIDIELSEGCFINVGMVNRLRRSALNELREHMLKSFRRD